MLSLDPEGRWQVNEQHLIEGMIKKSPLEYDFDFLLLDPQLKATVFFSLRMLLAHSFIQNQKS